MLIIQNAKLASTLAEAYDTFAKFERAETFSGGAKETAIGAPRPDTKSYWEFDNQTEVRPPKALAALRFLMMEIVQENYGRIEREWGSLERDLGHLVDQQKGPLLRMTSYPAGQKGVVNHPHTDIDLFTALPLATMRGLEIETGEGWKPVEISQDQMILLPGEVIQHFGGPAPVRHRVISDGSARLSVSLFVNADPSLQVGDREVGRLVTERLARVQGEAS